MSDWFVNGLAVESVLISDRGFQYGDGLFETVAIRNGEPRLWHHHMGRLARGCKLLGIRMPAENRLLEGVLSALEQSKASDLYATAKIIISSGPGQRGYGRSFADDPTILTRVFSSAPLALTFYKDGIDVVLCRTRLATGSVTAGVKTLNRIEQVLARSEFADTDLVEGLTMDADDNVICGTMSNVFFINDKTISTPPLDRCGVEGVMRKHIVETLHEQEINVEICPVRRSDLANCDEVFLSNSQFGVLPVKSCSQMTWPVGDVTRKTMSILASNGVPECRL